MDMYFNMHKIRFDKMNQLFNNNTPRDTLRYDRKVNIYINLESILRRLTRPDVVDLIKVSENQEFALISNIINLVAHYRLYFKSKRMENKVYLYTGYPFNARFDNKEILNMYRDAYKEKFTMDTYGRVIGNTIHNLMDILEVIIKHIGGVYIVKSDSMEPSVLPYAINRMNDDNDDLNVMVTTDRYDYQYTIENFIILRPKYKADYMVTSKNVLEMMAAEDKVRYNNSNNISINYLPIILSFLGSSARNIPKISGIGFSRMMLMINRGIKEGHLNNSTTSFYSFEKVLKDEVKDIILTNYMCTDLSTQYSRVENSKTFHLKLKESLVDSFNNVELRELSERFFEPRGLPIMLEEILPNIAKPKIKLFDDRRRP